ncbi:MAG: terpene cyclase/mutase family protein, partial [Parcubacteria group bacterium]|nr:terpene cyclase/mutase family protein [Parcubacteria group bacterium]
MKHFTHSIAFRFVAAAIAFGVFGHLVPSKAVVSPQTGAYLAALSPQTDWSVMARSATGQAVADASFLRELDGTSANDYATYILAITALGRDPRSFGNENLVYGLRQKASNGQIGDASMVSDDIFGLLALRAAGVPSNDSLVTQTVNYLKTSQLADGGWDWSAGATESSIDYTAMGIMALVAAGVAPSDDAVMAASDYLVNAQNDDGGFGILPGEPSNTASTAWVLSALHAMGDDPGFWAPDDKTTEDYLTARLHADGYFLFDASAIAADLFTPVSTSYAAIAMAGKYYPVASIAAPPTVTLRIEGQSETICDIEAQGRTSLDVIKSAAGPCNYTYVIQDTQYGPYLTTIAGEA